MNYRKFFYDEFPVSPITRRMTSQKIESLIRQAGKNRELPLKRVQVYQELCLWLSFSLTYGLYIYQKERLTVFVVGVALAVLAMLWPTIYLKRLVKRQKQQLIRELPAVLDRLSLQVAAGEQIENVIINLAKTEPGYIGGLFKNISTRLSLGFSLNQALNNEKVESNEIFRRFALGLNQGSRLGSGIARTLEIQAQLLRARRKNQAEERARKASVLVALPLVTCIFPALLIIYLVPIIINLMQQI